MKHRSLPHIPTPLSMKHQSLPHIPTPPHTVSMKHRSLPHIPTPPHTLSMKHQSLPHIPTPTHTLSMKHQSLPHISTPPHTLSMKHRSPFQVLLSSALHSWSTHGKEHGLSDKTQTAWKAFLCRMFALVGEKLPAGSYSIDGEIRSIRSRLNVQFAKEGSLEKPDVPEAWQNRYVLETTAS